MISELRVMRGPNSWSIDHHKLIIIRLNIPSCQDLNAITLKEKVSLAFPSIKINLNNELFKFSSGLSSSLLITLLTALIGKELQAHSEIDVNFYNAYVLGESSHYACFEYTEEEVGKLAAHSACKIVESFLAGKEYSEIENDLLAIKELNNTLFPGPCTHEILKSASTRRIPVQKIIEERSILFGHGFKQKKIHNSILKNIHFPILEHMFPDNDCGRIPVVAITGTNGKTTTTRLLAHIAKEKGLNVGFTTTDGIYRNETLIESGDCSGPESAQTVLSDPFISLAVLECARGGIIRSGLGFDQCDIGIITNIAEDHLGLKDIHTLEDLASVKSVVLQTVKENGYAILNADDKLTPEISKRLKCKIAYFSLFHENEIITKHLENDGLVITKDSSENIIIVDGKVKTIIENVKNIPLTMDGRASFMTENVMPAVLAGYILKFPLDVIRKAIKNFHPSIKHTPGRLNIFNVNDVNVMIDYAHNPHGFKALGNFLNNIPTHKTGIITAVGDRRNKDIIEIGSVAATIYDKIIIRLDDNLRGRPENEILSLIESGIKSVDPNFPYTVIHDSKEAVKHALELSQPGNYIVLSAEKVSDGIKMITELQAELNSANKKNISN